MNKQHLDLSAFRVFIKTTREKMGLNQSDFGHQLGIIMTDVSKIENGKKKFPFSKLEILANLIQMELEELKNLYVADHLVQEAVKYECTNSEVFLVAESKARYGAESNSKQTKKSI